jgi:uncharacterized metal-binding protein YceD (DUF177 family)
MSDFAHRLSLGQLHHGDRIDLHADDAERAAIADRLRLPSLERFDAQVSLARDGDIVRATGRIVAALAQSCVATGGPVAAHVDEPFDILFRTPPEVGADAEIELSEADCDVAFHDGTIIDLGTALADTLALALDPYPRSPAAADALKEAGVLSEEDVQSGPFAALAALKGTEG